MTQFKYENAPSNPRWTSVKNSDCEFCYAYDKSGGYFLAVRGKEGELLKEDFYVSDSGRAKALRRFLDKHETL